MRRAADGELVGTLEWLYGELKAAVEADGTLIAGPQGLKLHPAVPELRRLIVELNRMRPGEPAVEAEATLLELISGEAAPGD